MAVDFRSPSAAKKSGGAVGFYWNKMISDVKSVLADLGTLFPQYDKAKGYAVKGRSRRVAPCGRDGGDGWRW